MVVVVRPQRSFIVVVFSVSRCVYDVKQFLLHRKKVKISNMLHFDISPQDGWGVEMISFTALLYPSQFVYQLTNIPFLH